MILTPRIREELTAELARNFPAGGKIEKVDLSALSELVEHHPEDMTATAQAGMPLGAFQERLRASRQWLPIDPPGAEAMTVGELLALDASGPRRLGHGTIRDYLIGMKVVLADGTLIKAGGKVVKNVAGYDLCKLFIGARHSLGVILEATFKLCPLPEEEKFLQTTVQSLEELHDLRATLIGSHAVPVVCDAHNVEGTISVIMGFAGNREDVAAQVEFARAKGLSEGAEENYATRFFEQGQAKKLSVLPSRTVATLSELQAEQWLAHLGNGVIYHRGGKAYAEPPMPEVLMDRVKSAYDPKGIFPKYAA